MGDEEDRQENSYTVARDQLDVQRDILERSGFILEAIGELVVGLQGVAAQLDGVLAAITPPPVPPSVAVSETLTIQGANMPGAITVDSTGLKVYLGFKDDKGDVVDAPTGATATFTSDNTAALSLASEAAPATDPSSGKLALVADVTVGVQGTANVSVHATAADGTPLLEPDGVTPIPDPAPLALTVNPGAPAAEVLSEA